MREKIDILYKDICKIYFPRWKPWSFTYNPKWYGTGHCNTDEKRIYLAPPDTRLKVLIIHEICHAVGYPGHGKQWQERMLKAAETAKKHDPELSEKLIGNVEGYQVDP